jgi:hypothetical protein
VVALKNDLIPDSASSMITAGLLPRLVITEACKGQSTNRSGRCEGVSFDFVHRRSLKKGATSKSVSEGLFVPRSRFGLSDHLVGQVMAHSR